MNAKPLVVLFALLTGCAFGTNHVNLSPIPTTALPAGGPRTQVQTRDARAEMSGATVGFKRNGYGAKTGDVKLANDQTLADRLQGDVVSILRERGYQAGADDPGSELHCELEVVSFSVDVKQGFWSGALEGIAAVRIKIVDQAAGREIWNDIVRGENTKSGLQFVSGSDHQEVVEKLYSNLMVNIRAAVPDRRHP